MIKELLLLLLLLPHPLTHRPRCFLGGESALNQIFEVLVALHDPECASCTHICARAGGRGCLQRWCSAFTQEDSRRPLLPPPLTPQGPWSRHSTCQEEQLPPFNALRHDTPRQASPWCTLEPACSLPNPGRAKKGAPPPGRARRNARRTREAGVDRTRPLSAPR